MEDLFEEMYKLEESESKQLRDIEKSDGDGDASTIGGEQGLEEEEVKIDDGVEEEVEKVDESKIPL